MSITNTQPTCTPCASLTAQANAENSAPEVTAVDGRPSTKVTVSHFLRELADQLEAAELSADMVRLIWLPSTAGTAEIFIERDEFRRLEACAGMPAAITTHERTRHYRMGRLGLSFTSCEPLQVQR